jgi:hypothetical protein
MIRRPTERTSGRRYQAPNDITTLPAKRTPCIDGGIDSLTYWPNADRLRGSRSAQRINALETTIAGMTWTRSAARGRCRQSR